MRQKFWDKRIPTLFGIFLIVLGLGITTYLTNQVLPISLNANVSSQPQNVRITNVTDNSFTVSYSTDNLQAGSINYGKDSSLGQTGLDNRDQQGNLRTYIVHYITVKNLNPQTKYYFNITSGQQNYNNVNQLFNTATGPSLSTNSAAINTLGGKVVLPNGNPPKETIVYLTSDNSQVISTLTKPDGSYSFDLNTLRTSDLSSDYNITQDSSIKMLIFGDSLTSNVLLSINQNKNIPTITLSKDYDFRVNQSNIASPSANLQSFPSLESTASAKILQEKGPQILTPGQNQSFTDQQPVFKGTGVPNAKVQIIIHSTQVVQTSVITDAFGNWNFRPSTALSPGSHTITITTLDPSGILKTITQSFVVYAQGQQINPAAPSGTPTPTPTPFSTPTPTPFSTPTPTPFSTPTPTPAVISQLLQTPTPTDILISPTATPASELKLLPPTGNPLIMTAGIVGVIISITGSLLFLLTLIGV